MNTKKTHSRAMSLVPCLLLLAAAPFAGAAGLKAQVVGTATNADPNLERAISAQRKLVESRSRPGDRATALNDLANLLELKGDVAAAFEHYRAAIAADGTWAPSHYNLALLAYTTGDPELASSHLQMAIELEPGNAWAHYQLGRIADDASQAERAVGHYVRAVSLDSRLAFGDVNPHFTVNRHATEILLRADRSHAKVLPPRAYSQPGRISGLLVPGRVEEAAPRPAEVAESQEAELAESRENETARAGQGEVETSVVDRERLGQVNESPVPSDSDDILFQEPTVHSVSYDAPVTASARDEPTEAAADREAGREPRVFTREHLRSRTLGGGTGVAVPVGSSQPSSSPASGRRGELQVGTPVGPGGRQPASGGSSGTFGGSGGGRFEPTARSSAQLETSIRRFPAPAP